MKKKKTKIEQKLIKKKKLTNEINKYFNKI